MRIMRISDEKPVANSQIPLLKFPIWTETTPGENMLKMTSAVDVRDGILVQN